MNFVKYRCPSKKEYLIIFSCQLVFAHWICVVLCCVWGCVWMNLGARMRCKFLSFPYLNLLSSFPLFLLFSFSHSLTPSSLAAVLYNRDVCIMKPTHSVNNEIEVKLIGCCLCCLWRWWLVCQSNEKGWKDLRSSVNFAKETSCESQKLRSEISTHKRHSNHH